jgi:hypothetical protein
MFFQVAIYKRRQHGADWQHLLLRYNLIYLYFTLHRRKLWQLQSTTLYTLKLLLVVINVNKTHFQAQIAVIMVSVKWDTSTVFKLKWLSELNLKLNIQPKETVIAKMKQNQRKQDNLTSNYNWIWQNQINRL